MILLEEVERQRERERDGGRCFFSSSRSSHSPSRKKVSFHPIEKEKKKENADVEEGIFSRTSFSFSLKIPPFSRRGVPRSRDADIVVVVNVVVIFFLFMVIAMKKSTNYLTEV